MTKERLREKYLEWNREIGGLGDRKTEIIKELQEMCVAEGDGICWCGLEKLTKAVTDGANNYTALHLYAEYHEICGREEALRDLALATNNFEI